MNTKKLTSAALASALSIGLATAASAAGPHHPEKPTYNFEKCYGVAKAGQNDCYTSTHSCGSTSKLEGDKSSWIYVPKGTCEKIVSGSLSEGK